MLSMKFEFFILTSICHANNVQPAIVNLTVFAAISVAYFISPGIGRRFHITIAKTERLEYHRHDCNHLFSSYLDLEAHQNISCSSVDHGIEMTRQRVDLILL
jgi:hypothetical protein